MPLSATESLQSDLAVSYLTAISAPLLSQFAELISGEKEGVGKTLEFVLQEMNREANTIGSKTSDVEVTKSVIAIKSELEKIREQLQNIE